jgi:transposase, IS30 family
MPGSRLSEWERCRIEGLWVAGCSIPEIARVLGRHRVSVWREVTRNSSYRHGPKHAGRGRGEPAAGARGPYRWGYDAARAQVRATARARRPRQVKLGFHPVPETGQVPGRRGNARGAATALRTVVVGKLAHRWSPQQITRWLAANFPGQPEWQVSHETIYQALFVQSRGALREELTYQVALRTGRAMRRARREVAGPIRSRRPWAAGLNISTRPPEAADRAIPGHWEGDLVMGKNNASAIITLVERSTRYVMLGHLPAGRDSAAVIDVLSTLAQRLPTHLLRSVTWDCGTEMARHATFTVVTGCPVFFADPHAPWQRGSNENTNGLLE